MTNIKMQQGDPRMGHHGNDEATVGQVPLAIWRERSSHWHMPDDPTNPAKLELSTAEDVLHQVFMKLEERGQRGIETGFSELDEMLNGLHRGQMVVIGSRPSMGRSAFAMNILEHVSCDSRIPTAAFTMEMSREEYAERMLWSRAKLDGHRMRKGLASSSEYAHLAKVVGEIAKSTMFVTSAPDVQLTGLCDAVRESVASHSIQLVAVDYVQLIDAPGENRAEQLALISRKLKALALELNIALLCLSALSRPSPDRIRPKLSDLRGSGTLEDEADVVLLLHREDLYRTDEIDFQPDNIAEVLVAKHRHGPTGTLKLEFLPKCTRFVDLKYDEAVS